MQCKDPGALSYLCAGEPLGPPGESVIHNMWVASSRVGLALTPGDLWWFKEMVKTGGPWDYKKDGNSQYENFGNFNYGATGRAMGIPVEILLRAAGYVQMKGINYKAEFGHFMQGAPYGDDPKDQDWIMAGMAYARKKGYG